MIAYGYALNSAIVVVTVSSEPKHLSHVTVSSEPKHLCHYSFFINIAHG